MWDATGRDVGPRCLELLDGHDAVVIPTAVVTEAKHRETWYLLKTL